MPPCAAVCAITPVRAAPVVIDEVGYLSYSNRHADLMFELISRRYQNKSTLVTTNRPFAEWREVFPNAACVVSLIDRFLPSTTPRSSRSRAAILIALLKFSPFPPPARCCCAKVWVGVKRKPTTAPRQRLPPAAAPCQVADHTHTHTHTHTHPPPPPRQPHNDAARPPPRLGGGAGRGGGGGGRLCASAAAHPVDIPRTWTPEEALAVFELIDDLRDKVWALYSDQLQALLRERCAHHHADDRDDAIDTHPF